MQRKYNIAAGQRKLNASYLEGLEDEYEEFAQQQQVGKGLVRLCAHALHEPAVRRPCMSQLCAGNGIQLVPGVHMRPGGAHEARGCT